MNKTNSFPITFAGHLDHEGNCKGAAYADPYGSWDSVVVQGLIKITIQKQEARIDLNTNKIHLQSGITCILSDESCIDVEGGYSFWDPIPVSTCQFNQYSILYEGLADKLIDSETVYSLSTNDITFALTIKNKVNLCGYMIMRTEHPKLIIFETEKGISFAENGNIYVSNFDIFSYINSKFVYVEKHIKSQMQYLYWDALMQRCNLERETIKNALAIATQAPDQFAYNLMKGPGYMAVTAGEVVHIIKCIPVDVKIEHGENCYAELQVTRRNTTYYMTPKTHVLKSTGTKITCNPLLPSHFFINEDWYKIMPRPSEAKKPITIQPMTKPTWSYVSPASLAVSGIYTEKDLDDLRDHIMFPVEKPALLNDIAREIHGHPVNDNEGTIFRLLNDNAVEKIMKSTWGKIWTKFITFGTASAGVLAIFIIFQGIKMLVEVIINGYLLHQVYGCSVHLLGAIWNTLARLLLSTKEIQQQQNYHQRYNADMDRDIEKGAPMELMPLDKPPVRVQPTAPTNKALNQGFFIL